MKSFIDWEVVKTLIAAGWAAEEIAVRMDCSVSTISSNRKTRGLKFGRKKNIIDWKSVQVDYDSGLGRSELVRKYGISDSAFLLASKRGVFIPRTRSDSAKIRAKRIQDSGGWHHTQETKERLSSIMQHKMSNRKPASKRFIYKGFHLESTYEYNFAVLLDIMNINWVRPSPLLYKDDMGQQRRYYPDFLLTDIGQYVDTKNSYLIIKDKRKLELVRQQNNVVVHVVGVEDINEEGILKIVTLG